jgi:hypothetical protein
LHYIVDRELGRYHPGLPGVLTSLWYCAPLPQVSSKGYHIRRPVAHPDLPGVLTSLRNCAPLPQVSSKGYHIRRPVAHPGLPRVLTSLRNCAPLPQVSSKGYHIGRPVAHPGLPEVLHCFETALLYPRSHPRDIISGGSRPTWGTTLLRNCVPLPQIQSKGYHIGRRAVAHPGLPGVLHRFETVLFCPIYGTKF